MKKRVISLALVAALVTGLLAGCAKEPKNVTPDTQQGTEQPKKQYTFSVYTMRITPDPESEIMKEITQKLGQKLQVTAVADADYFTKLNILISSNDLPDLYSAYSTNLPALKAAATITEDELKKYMPGGYKSFTERAKAYGYNNESLLNRWKVDGALKGFTNGSLGNAIPYGVMLRTDILDTLGVKMPATIADWDELLKAYKIKYPNKYPLTARGKDAFTQSFYYFLCAYGVHFCEWMFKDNKLSYSPFMPEMKEALTQLQKWYKAGYINPEWFTMDNTALNNEFINGNTIFVQYFNTNNKMDPPYDTSSVQSGQIQAQTLAKNQNAKFDWAPFPTIKAGIKPTIANGDLFGSALTLFGNQLSSDKDKLHTLMSTWDKLFNDKDLFILMKYGKEGKTYDIKYGAPVVKAEYSTNEAKGKVGFGWPFLGSLDADDEITNATNPDFVTKTRDKLINDPNGIYGKNTVNYMLITRVNGPLTTPSGETLDSRNQAFVTQWNTMFSAYIMGEKSSEDYDKFIADWKKQIGDQMTEAANRLYLKQWMK